MKLINLCDTCKFEFAICHSNPTFASETDDRVVECDKYKTYEYWV